MNGFGFRTTKAIKNFIRRDPEMRDKDFIVISRGRYKIAIVYVNKDCRLNEVPFPTQKTSITDEGLKNFIESIKPLMKWRTTFPP